MTVDEVLSRYETRLHELDRAGRGGECEQERRYDSASNETGCSYCGGTRKEEGMAPMNELIWLQNWFAVQCDGVWEHAHGIKIDTLDNPGWTVHVDLEGIQSPPRE